MPEKMARFTFDTPLPLHRAVKLWATNHDTTIALVSRTLLELLVEDPEIAQRVEAALRGEAVSGNQP